MSFSEEFVPLTPVNFFQLNVECLRLPAKNELTFPSLKGHLINHYLLPDTSKLCGEEHFADVAMGWHEEGIEFVVQVDSPFKKASYPSVELGDSFEVFIDTRDVKTSGFNTRFCHHFFFLAEGVDGHFAGEITRFRTEDTHPLCDDKDLKVKALTNSSNYTLHIFIPSTCLYGYDPTQFKRMGFSYRVNRSMGFPQHFSVVTDDFAIEQQPSLWSSIKLV